MNLAAATKLSRKILRITGIGIGALIIIFLLIKGITFTKNAFFPSPPPPPEQKFGKLKNINFPKQNNNITYKLNTFTGNLPNFPDRITVYKFSENQPDLLDLNNVQKKLGAINFSTGQLKLSNEVYQWSNTTYPKMFIQYNIVSGNFDLFSDFRTNSNLLAQGAVSKETVSSRIFDFLNSLGENLDDIDKTKTSFYYFKINNGSLVPAENPSQAQIIKASLFQKQIDKKEIHYPYYDSSIINLFIGNTIVQSHFNHKIVDLNTYSTYSIKTAQQAFSDLKSGNALILNQDNKNQVEITDVSLAYFIGENTQDYLMPIVVFKGKNFKAYVSAILP